MTALVDDPAVFVERMALGGDGARVGVKDSIDVAGFPTRMGSACLADAPPAVQHAAVVRSLLDAGCRIVGKTNLHELAYGLTGINRWTGTPVNPRAPTRVPGGSSSGSAVAVAAGLVDFALGNDTGGSIRLPAACCGVAGLKPSFGRVSRAGVHPERSTLDCVGPLAREVSMIERAMALIDATFRPQAVPAQAVIGWVQVEADAEVSAAARAALDRAGFEVRCVSLPTFAAAFPAALTIIGAETWTAFGHLAGCEQLGADVRLRLGAARAISSVELAAAEALRARWRAEVDAALSGLDALALPTLPELPLTLAAAADARAALDSSRCVRPFNLSGHPAITLPIAVQGVPAGLQLVGRAQQDEALCALARGVEGALVAEAGCCRSG
ncbi:MAG TPA: amidase [Steroidobacteraceae bacterium]|nr:amidase [Steroidobacteraceae bacterium]